MYGRIFDPGMELCPPRVELTLQTLGSGFHTVLGGIKPGEHRFRSRFLKCRCME